MKNTRCASVVLLLSLGACVTLPPSGPSMTVLPGTGKSFDQFRDSDMECRDFASTQAGGTAASAAEDSAVRSGALGTVIGAVAGAAIGGRQGAAVGAGTGLIAGSVAGTGAGAVSARNSQQRYDAGYVQCMYAKGHKVPVSGQFSETPRQQERRNPSPPPPANYSPSYPPPPPVR
jgi:hypothetical protein